ncbi:winged helix-turn-helix transcriptional regulator [Acinetobacter sp. ANC 4640]
MSKVKYSRFNCSPGCSVEAAIGLLDGKWKCIVLWHLLKLKVMRFNEIRKSIPNVTPRMLTNQLRELEEDGLIIRTVYPQVPPKVEYQLSELGKSLEPILFALKQWGDTHIGLYGKPHQQDVTELEAELK